MSLGPYVIREPGDELPVAERAVYRAFIDSLNRPTRTTPERAIMRAARRCGVSRARALAIVTAVNADIHPDERTYP